MKSPSIKFLFIAAIAIVSVLMAMVVLGIQRLGAAFDRVFEANEARYASYLLADEVRQGSDDVTRLVRTYAGTGDPKWQYAYTTLWRNWVDPIPDGRSGIAYAATSRHALSAALNEGAAPGRPSR